MTRAAAGEAPDEAISARDIYAQFRGLIVSGQLGAHERLPTVRQTAGDLGVAPGTAAKAYKMLEQEGLVVSRTAAGTRVTESAAVLPLPVMRRLRDLVDEAAARDTPADDVIDVLRVLWPTASAVSATERVEGGGSEPHPSVRGRLEGTRPRSQETE